MRVDIKSIILVFLMLILSLSVATNSLNGEVETPNFEETVDPLNVILPIANLNEPGFQEGSIFTDTTLSSGAEHTCAILDNGSVSCWGDNVGLGRGGAVGDAHNETPGLTYSLGEGRTAISISSGDAHTCVILDNGSVSCWGYGRYGQLGNGSYGHTSYATIPTLTSSLGVNRTAVAISSGGDYTCVILDNGSVSCWGRGIYGQLGNGNNSDKTAPTLVSSLGAGRTAVAIASGQSHTCAILDNGSVACWGTAQLGDGGASSSNTPVLTSSLGAGRTAVAITAGEEHT